MYNIPDDLIFDQYLDLVKKLNPALEDMNLVKPDQTIELPSVAAYQLSPRLTETSEQIVQEEDTKEVVREEPVAKKDLSKEKRCCG